MNTNTNTNSIPNTKLGEIYFPKLVMGIHPFDGVSYKSSEQDRINLKMFGNVTSVSKVIKFAVEKHLIKNMAHTISSDVIKITENFIRLHK